MTSTNTVEVLILSNGQKVSASYVEHLIRGIAEGKQFYSGDKPIPAVGSTKPTYSELETQLAELKRGLRNNNTDFDLAFLDHYLDHFKTLTNRAEAAEAENLRVRGLLQRQWISVEERLPEPSNEMPRPWYLLYGNGTLDFGLFLSRDRFFMGRALQGKEITHWQPQPDPPNFRQSSSLVSQGAESADIGKLDDADKLGKFIDDSIDAMTPEQLAKFRKDADAIMQKSRAGSAETGGEKAAPHQEHTHEANNVSPCWACVRSQLKAHASFRRTSQNQTVSSGVEGAHEGTTVDKSVALAESSLSPPPPRFDTTGLAKKICWEIYGDESLSAITIIADTIDYIECHPTFRQSSSLSESGAESAHSGKQNTADKSELLPTQLPKEK